MSLAFGGVILFYGGEGGSTLVISDVSNTANNGALCELGCNEFPSERITSA